jgi:hypothetical protein
LTRELTVVHVDLSPVRGLSYTLGATGFGLSRGVTRTTSEPPLLEDLTGSDAAVTEARPTASSSSVMTPCHASTSYLLRKSGLCVNATDGPVHTLASAGGVQVETE